MDAVINVWTHERREELRRLLVAGLYYRQIAEAGEVAA